MFQLLKLCRKTVEASKVQFPDRVADVPVISRRHAPGLLIQEEIVEAVPPPRVCEEIAELNDAYKKFYEQLAKCMKLNFVKGVVDSEELPLNISRETLQNKILRVIMKNHADKWLDMFAEIAEQKDDYKMFYEQFVKYMKLEIAEVLRFNTTKPGDEQNNLVEYVDRIKEGQNDVYHIASENTAVVSSSPFEENWHEEGLEEPHVADPMDEYAVYQFKESDGTKLNPTTKEGLNLGDDDEKQTPEELKVKLKSLTKLMKEVLGDKIEAMTVSDRIVEFPCVLATSEYGWSAKMERIMEAQGLRDNSMTSHMVSKKTTEVNPTHSIMMELKSRHDLHGHLQQQQQRKSSKHQPTKQSTRQERGGERKKERNREGKGGRSELEEERDQEGRKEEERKVEERGKQVEEDVAGWTEVTRKKREEDGPDLRESERVQDEPDGGEFDRRQSRRRDEADPERRERVCDTARKSAKERRKVEKLRSY